MQQVATDQNDQNDPDEIYQHRQWLLHSLIHQLTFENNFLIQFLHAQRVSEINATATPQWIGILIKIYTLWSINKYKCTSGSGTDRRQIKIHHPLAANQSVTNIKLWTAVARVAPARWQFTLTASGLIMLYMSYIYMHMHVLKVWRIIKNMTPSIDAYLHKEQSRWMSSKSDLKWRNLQVF